MDAEDFVYLRNQMSSQPGVIDPAGYRLISGITARDNAKTITVTFAKPYPGWRSLFADLLPAHLLKDAPGGFANGLNDSFPATAGLSPSRRWTPARRDRAAAQRPLLGHAERAGPDRAAEVRHRRAWWTPCAPMPTSWPQRATPPGWPRWQQLGKAVAADHRAAAGAGRRAAAAEVAAAGRPGRAGGGGRRGGPGGADRHRAPAAARRRDGRRRPA